MHKYIAGRFVAMFITLYIIVSASFFLIRLMPMNIFEHPDLPPFVVEMMYARLHLDRPIYVQYFYFVRGVFLQGDFGTSIIIRPTLPVFTIIRERIPITMTMNIVSLFISLPIGIIAGTIAALKKDKRTDHIISFMVIIFISIPSFVFASLMQYLFTFVWSIFPTLYQPNASSFAEYSRSLTLPIIALALGPIATVARYLRGELIETMSSEFLLLARTKGLSHAQAIVRHAFRNSCVPLANIIIPMFTGIMGGSLVIERIFAIPGMGGIMINSINAGDHPMTIATIIFFSIITLITIFIVDISYGLIDPRIRMGGRK
ncbi:MAG: ABC transporter permease [Treponema sp.]|nr:ABC transporter permease [Treponema sp.]